MKKIILSTLLSFCCTCLAWGQQKKATVYLSPQEISKAESYLQSTHLSRIGAAKKSIERHCYGYDELKLNSSDLSDINQSKVVDAYQYIESKIGSHQIIFINEVHHSNRQRKFVADLLPSFKKMGFTYFGAETFDHQYMDDLNKTKKPTLQTGYYSVSPPFGELIRTAAELDFTFYAYEDQKNYQLKSKKIAAPTPPKFNGDSMDLQMNQFNYDMNLRSYYQFTQIERLLEKNPTAKIIIYCGYDHLNEENIFDWIPLGARIKKHLNIDPLTIDLTILSEKCGKDVLPSYLAIGKLNIKKPSVLITKNNETFKPRRVSKQRDIFVYLPPSSYKNNRPTWLFNEKYKAYQLKKSKKMNGLVLVYYRNENRDEAIPADIIHVTKENPTPILCLKKGKYRIEYISTKGKKKTKKIKVR